MYNIRKATRKDKARVLDILTEAFWNDPHIRWFVGTNQGKGKRIRAMMSFSFEEAISRGDVYITEDGEGAAIWRNQAHTPFTRQMLWEYAKFIALFGFKKIQAIQKLEAAIKQRYPKDRTFFYLYILGTSSKGRGKGLSSQLMNALLDEADQRGLETYLETATDVNINIYARKGFEVYDRMNADGKDPMTVNFLRRPPQKKK